MIRTVQVEFMPFGTRGLPAGLRNDRLQCPTRTRHSVGRSVRGRRPTGPAVPSRDSSGAAFDHAEPSRTVPAMSALAHW